MRLFVVIVFFNFFSAQAYAQEWGNCNQVFGSFENILGDTSGAERKASERKGKIKDFTYTTKDALRKADSLIDLPTPEGLLEISRHLTISEFEVLKFIDEKIRLPYGFRVVQLDCMPSPTEIQYSERVYGRTVSDFLNDQSIDIDERTDLWERFNENLATIQRFVENDFSDLDIYVDEIEGFGMQFEIGTFRFSITTCGTTVDPRNDDFVLVEPHLFD